MTLNHNSIAPYFSWYVSAHVAYIRLPAVVDYDYLVNANNTLLTWLEQSHSNHAVHLITDARDVVEFPNNVLRLREVSFAFNHERMGWAVIVSKNVLVRFLGATVPKIVLKRRTRVFDQPVNAIEFLRYQISDVSWQCADDSLFATAPR